MTSQSSIDRIRLGITNDWGGTLHPALQHTLGGDLVLSNQFDPLVGTDQNGVIVPAAALSWTVSPDQRVFTFQIDTTLRFSDGSQLQATDFKRSWEAALQLNPKSSNGSLLDLLYKMEGFDAFREVGEISGIEVVSPDILTLRFKTPFRMALDHLTGVRFAAFKENNGNLVGTGRYTIREKPGKVLGLEPNSYHKDRARNSVDLIYLGSEVADAALRSHEVDGLAFIFGDEVAPHLLDDSSMEVIYGQDALHLVLEVNGTTSSLMSNPQHRQALQYLLYEIQKSGGFPHVLNSFARSDFQIFLPLQPGRLADVEALALIEYGKKHVAKLKEASASNPLTLIGGPGADWVINLLAQNGIKMSKKSREFRWDQLAEFYYKRDDYDVLYGGFSVVNGDPDGLYHALGKNGAILNPVMLRPRVADLLEEGRRIIKPEDLNLHYAEVARAILQEVPVIHLGFTKSMAVLNKARLNGENVRMRRNQGQVHVFTPKRRFGL